MQRLLVWLLRVQNLNQESCNLIDFGIPCFMRYGFSPTFLQWVESYVRN